MLTCMPQDMDSNVNYNTELSDGIFKSKMNKEKVIATAKLRNIYFDGVKKHNKIVFDNVYEIVFPNNGRAYAATLTGAYRKIMQYPKVRSKNHVKPCKKHNTQ